MNRKEQYTRLINTARWRELRRWKLSRNPLCEQCADNETVTPATEVHHVKPVEDGRNAAEMGRLMYDSHNLRSLCHRCHVEAHKALGRTGKDYAKRRRRDERQKFRELFLGRGKPAEPPPVASGGISLAETKIVKATKKASLRARKTTMGDPRG